MRARGQPRLSSPAGLPGHWRFSRGNGFVMSNHENESRGIDAGIAGRKRAEAALEESAEAFRALAESLPQLIWICNPTGAHVYFNQRWVEYTGLTLEESYDGGW